MNQLSNEFAPILREKPELTPDQQKADVAARLSFKDTLGKKVELALNTLKELKDEK